MRKKTNNLLGKKAFKVSFVFVAIVCGCGMVLGQGLCSTGPTASLTSVSADLFKNFGRVRFHREEQLEDRFIVHGLAISDFDLIPHFYQVQSPRFDLSKGFVEESSTDKLPTMYVASSSDGSQIYRLFGFPKPEEEFNRLVDNSPAQKITNAQDAEMRGLLCGEIVYGLAARWWVADPSNAELQAAEHFFGRGSKDGLMLGNKWWKSIRVDPATISIHTVKREHGYMVTLPIFWAPVEGDIEPEIKINAIEVSGEGKCRMKTEPTVIRK